MKSNSRALRLLGLVLSVHCSNVLLCRWNKIPKVVLVSGMLIWGHGINFRHKSMLVVGSIGLSFDSSCEKVGDFTVTTHVWSWNTRRMTTAININYSRLCRAFPTFHRFVMYFRILLGSFIAEKKRRKARSSHVPFDSSKLSFLENGSIILYFRISWFLTSNYVSCFAVCLPWRIGDRFFSLFEVVRISVWTFVGAIAHRAEVYRHQFNFEYVDSHKP